MDRRYYFFDKSGKYRYFNWEISKECFERHNGFWKDSPRATIYMTPFMYKLGEHAREEEEFKGFCAEVKKIVEGLSKEEQIKGIVQLVRRTTYAYDSKNYNIKEYWASPIETLYLGSGDCEDISILCCAVLAELGLDSVLIVMTSHAVFGVEGDFSGFSVKYNGKKFYYTDSTSKDSIGVIDDYYKKKFKIVVRGH